MSIEDLQRSHAIPGVATIAAGKNGLPKIHITTPDAQAEIYLHGAQVTSYIPAGEEEVLFLSEQSHFAAGKAIRGGIPVCFPWFRAKADDPKAPSHGVVRTKEWTLDSIEQGAHGEVIVSLSTQSNDETKQFFSGDFHLSHRITVGKTLRLELTTKNTGKSAFAVEEAQHTYFNVGDVQYAVITGLDGATYLDNTDNNAAKHESGDVTLLKATDSAYTSTARLTLHDPILDRHTEIKKKHSATTIVWNPWHTGAAALSDLGNDEWQTFLCVEAGNIMADAISIAPGTEHTLTTEIHLGA